ncbi:hypothetical protein CPLU01_12204 [Colletotrichum plurivorum]|uniref:Uncharacterized protein n=1 Tax=Colletotrichum plurivorum TaxID=2175906 RepID=A0A8H6N7C3_9PEZI|nr:hypothetical protein CPLU01_12204 [Colletotrichum plurivorum]
MRKGEGKSERPGQTRVGSWWRVGKPSTLSAGADDLRYFFFRNSRAASSLPYLGSHSLPRSPALLLSPSAGFLDGPAAPGPGVSSSSPVQLKSVESTSTRLDRLFRISSHSLRSTLTFDVRDPVKLHGAAHGTVTFDFRLVTRCRASSRRNGSPFSENRDQPRNASAIAITVRHRHHPPAPCPCLLSAVCCCPPVQLLTCPSEDSSTEAQEYSVRILKAGEGDPSDQPKPT